MYTYNRVILGPVTTTTQLLSSHHPHKLHTAYPLDYPRRSDGIGKNCRSTSSGFELAKQLHDQAKKIAGSSASFVAGVAAVLALRVPS